MPVLSPQRLALEKRTIDAGERQDMRDVIRASVVFGPAGSNVKEQGDEQRRGGGAPHRLPSFHTTPRDVLGCDVATGRAWL